MTENAPESVFMEELNRKILTEMENQEQGKAKKVLKVFK